MDDAAPVNSTAHDPPACMTIVCHGEILNQAMLCEELGLPVGTALQRLLTAGWQRWSLGLLARLDGVFALELRDGDELLLYRDPSGLQSLYWQQRPDGTVTVANHLCTLATSVGAPPRMARHSLHEYLRFLEVAPPHTLLHDVCSLEAGQALRFRGHQPATMVRLPPTLAVDEPSSFSEALDGLEERLSRSIQLRLNGAMRPAAFLSGGVDSSLLCALAARERKNLTAVTVGFEGAAYDESPIAQRIAGHIGIAHEVLRFTRAEFLGAFERLSSEAEQPMADPAAMATLLAFEHCRDRFDVVLDGTGADELLGTMPPRHVRLAVGYASRLPSNIRRHALRILRATPGLIEYSPVLDFDHPADTMSRWHGFTRMEIEQLCDEHVSLEHTQFLRTYHRFPRHAHFERYSALLNAMTCDRLNQAMLISSATIRFPFWDAEIDHFIRRLRTDHRYLPGQPKRILRSLLARYVPTRLWDLPKHGFNFPLREFLTGDDFQLLRQHLLPGIWQEHGHLNVQQVQHYARQFMAGNERVTFRVWALVVLGAWLERNMHRMDLSA